MKKHKYQQVTVPKVGLLILCVFIATLFILLSYETLLANNLNLQFCNLESEIKANHPAVQSYSATLQLNGINIYCEFSR